MFSFFFSLSLIKVILVSQEQSVVKSAVAFCLALPFLAYPTAIGFLAHFLSNHTMFIVIGFEQTQQIELWMICNII